MDELIHLLRKWSVFCPSEWISKCAFLKILLFVCLKIKFKLILGWKKKSTVIVCILKNVAQKTFFEPPVFAFFFQCKFKNVEKVARSHFLPKSFCSGQKFTEEKSWKSGSILFPLFQHKIFWQRFYLAFQCTRTFVHSFAHFSQFFYFRDFIFSGFEFVGKTKFQGFQRITSTFRCTSFS